MGERRLHFWDDDEWRAVTESWPLAVQRRFASQLRIVQHGAQPASHAKPLTGFAIPLWELWHRDGQRVVYTVHYASSTGRIDVLDAFEKDSRHGRKMRTNDRERIIGRVARLKREMDELEARLRAFRRTLH